MSGFNILSKLVIGKMKSQEKWTPLLHLRNKKVKIATTGYFNNHFIKEEPREVGLHRKMQINLTKTPLDSH